MSLRDAFNGATDSLFAAFDDLAVPVVISTTTRSFSVMSGLTETTTASATLRGFIQDREVTNPETGGITFVRQLTLKETDIATLSIDKSSTLNVNGEAYSVTGDSRTNQFTRTFILSRGGAS